MVIGDSRNGLTNAELARTLSVPKSTLSKILNSLAQNEWVALDPVSKRYRLGSITLSLACKYIDNLDLVRLGQKFLRRLKEETGEMACMQVPNGNEVVVVAKVAADDARMSDEVFSGEVLRLAELGQRAPLYATAAGKCILASRTDAEIEQFIEDTRFVPLTRSTITEPKRLWKQIQQTRVSGLAYNTKELNTNTIAIAAPVRDLYGRTIATLGVVTPDFRFNGSKKLLIEESVRRSADDFSRMLGFQKR